MQPEQLGKSEELTDHFPESKEFQNYGQVSCLSLKCHAKTLPYNEILTYFTYLYILVVSTLLVLTLLVFILLFV